MKMRTKLRRSIYNQEKRMKMAERQLGPVWNIKRKAKEKYYVQIDRQNHDPLTILDIRETLDKALKSKEVTYCASTVHKQWTHTKLT
jgi:hypothetical protein